MKKVLYIYFLISTLLISCEDDYENNNSIDSRNEFIGNWLVREKSMSVGERNFAVEINKHPLKSNTVTIQNFYALGNSDTVDANVSSIEINTFIIPSQLVRNNRIHGSGALTDNEIKMIYYVDDGNTVDSVSATFTRDLY